MDMHPVYQFYILNVRWIWTVNMSSNASSFIILDQDDFVLKNQL